MKPGEGHFLDTLIAQYADGTKFRFPKDGQSVSDSDAVAKRFGEWLSAKQQTIMSHNFRTYVGHFILKYLLGKEIEVIKRGTQLLDFPYQKAEINARNTLSFVQQKPENFSTTCGGHRNHNKKMRFCPLRRYFRKEGQTHSISGTK